MQSDTADAQKFSFLNWKKLLVLALLLAGIYLRVEDYLGGHWPYYIHDRNRHLEYIQYVHDTGALPPPDQGIEFPQQPLYYFLVAHVYNSNSNWRINDAILAGVGLLISITGLIILACSLKYISSWIVRFVLLSFVLFTPSFILCAPFIGNDGMVQVMGFYTFFCVMRFNRNPHSTGAFLTLALALAFTLFSKLNAISLTLIIPWALWRSFQSSGGVQRLSIVGRRAAVFVAVLLLWGGVTWYHGRLGRGEAGFKMVTIDKSGLSPLFIPDTGVGYLCSFQFFDLVEAGQATTTDSTSKAVRFSFPTFQYGNMLFGEQAYNKPPELARGTSPVILSGVVLLIGAMLFFARLLLNSSRHIWNWTRFRSGIEKQSFAILTVGIVMASTLAVYNYVRQVPYTCDADFRFQYPALAWFGYAIGCGLATFPHRKWFGYISTILMSVYIISCILLISDVFQYAFRS